MLLVVMAAFAANPVVEARWQGGKAELRVQAPAGEHVNAEAPARFSAGSVEASGLGSLDWARLPVGTGEVVFAAEVPLCTDDGRSCRSVAVQGRVAVAGKKGSVRLEPSVAAPAPVAAPGAAVRLLDFSAVWCPPCNQMKAEVLDDPEDAALLAPYTVEVLDVDQPASWPQKSRYKVGGYPTVVAVDASGGEVDRYIGYVSEDHFRAWLSGLTGATPLATLEAGSADATKPKAAAESALRLARAGKLDAAARWLVPGGEGTPAWHEAQLLVSPAEAHADWLLANGPAGDWMVTVLGKWPAKWPKVAPRLWELPPDLVSACLQVYAESASPETALVARAGALGISATHLDGDPTAARAFVTEAADLRAQTGSLPGALALLDAYAARYPGEFTFDFTASRLLLEAGRFAEAEERGRAALGKAWGDQRLRAVVRLARALDGAGKRTEAVAALKAELAALPEPPAGVEVRTSRYRAEATKLLTELEAKK